MEVLSQTNIWVSVAFNCTMGRIQERTWFGEIGPPRALCYDMVHSLILIAPNALWRWCYVPFVMGVGESIMAGPDPVGYSPRYAG